MDRCTLKVRQVFEIVPVLAWAGVIVRFDRASHLNTLACEVVQLLAVDLRHLVHATGGETGNRRGGR
jgi:hypothetical protein